MIGEVFFRNPSATQRIQAYYTFTYHRKKREENSAKHTSICYNKETVSKKVKNNKSEVIFKLPMQNNYGI